LPGDINVARLCRMAVSDAYEHVDMAIHAKVDKREKNLQVKVAKLKSELHRRRAKKTAGEAMDPTYIRLHTELEEAEKKLIAATDSNIWHDFQMAVLTMKKDVELELDSPYTLRPGEERHREIMVIMPDKKVYGPYRLDALANETELRKCVMALLRAEEAMVSHFPDVYHFLMNGRPFVGNIARTLSLNGSYCGVLMDNQLYIVEGPEPFRDVMEKAPTVMKARLMNYLGITRDVDFPTADKDVTPYAKDLAYEEYMIGLGICPQCDVALIWMEDVSETVCPACATSRKQVDTEFRATFTTHTSVTKTNHYERKEHFLTLLKDFQGKESKEVSEEIYDDIIDKLAEKKLLDPELMDAELMRRVLKDTGHANCYKHVNNILYKLFGIPPPQITDGQVKDLLSRFMALQMPWERMSPKEKEGRKNMLNYFYVMRKLCEIAGFNWLIPRFRLLKHQPRLATYDRIWQKLMQQMPGTSWPFIPTVATSRDTARKIARI